MALARSGSWTKGGEKVPGGSHTHTHTFSKNWKPEKVEISPLS